MKAKLKGVYTLNPTRQVFKQASRQARKGVTSDVPGYRTVKRPKVNKVVKVNRGTRQ